MRLPSFIRKRVPRFLREWKHPHLKTSPVLGLGDDGTKKKRALVSYITMPFRLRPGHPDHIRFSNNGIARNIVRALNELGYMVDVVEWSDTKFTPKRKYDLFLGHGGTNFVSLAGQLPADIAKIYFSSGTYWKHFNDAEEARFAALVQRRGVRLAYDRWIHESEENANRTADGIICLGNEVARETYASFPVVRNVNNAAYPEPRNELAKKNFGAARRNFLFFSGGGNVHKGLDLLLEAFSRVNAHLWICQHIVPEFWALYRKELEEQPNIHTVGTVPMRSPEYYALADRCAYVIHPSCAEGCVGSVVECMHQGLVPVVSRESTVETGDYGITLKNCSIEEIARTVEELSQKPAEWCAEKSRATRAAAEQNFSEVAFLKNIRGAFESALRRPGGDGKD
jgi:glycosyltransferase involved in cell wall biosynthesis